VYSYNSNCCCVTLPFPTGGADNGLLQPQDKSSRHRCHFIQPIHNRLDYSHYCEDRTISSPSSTFVFLDCHFLKLYQRIVNITFHDNSTYKSGAGDWRVVSEGSSCRAPYYLVLDLEVFPADCPKYVLFLSHAAYLFRLLSGPHIFYFGLGVPAYSQFVFVRHYCHRHPDVFI
jgi:hypothetical protein